MDEDFIAETRSLIDSAIAHGWAVKTHQEAVSVRSKYRSIRSPEDEFEFQKKTVANIRKQLDASKNPKGEKMKPTRIRLGMALKRLDTARTAMGMS